MTRKDYVLIAKSIKGALDYENNFKQDQNGARVISHVAQLLALSLIADNPNFDRARFLDACGVK